MPHFLGRKLTLRSQPFLNYVLAGYPTLVLHELQLKGLRMKPSVLIPLLTLILFGIACSSTSNPTPTAGALPTATSPPSGSDVGPSIDVLSPFDGYVSTTGVIPVRIQADENLSISVNGQLADAEVGGTYSTDLLLEEGANLVEVVAAALDGTSTSTDRVVFNIGSASSPALDLYFPSDGHISSSEFVQIIGATSPGASVSIDGQLVTPDSLGIFDQVLELVDGPNLVEVVVVGLDGSSTTQSIVIFVEKS